MESSLYLKTPLIKQVLGPEAPSGVQIYIKSEFSQPSGSFKSRGIGHLISKRALTIQHVGKKSAAVYSSSGGNAGLAAATASKILGLPCTVVVPQTTKGGMISKIRDEGADVIVKGAHWKEADSYLCENVIKSAQKSGIEPIYVHPFDNPDIWDGHSSIVDEIIQCVSQDNISLQRVKAVVCSVGGGGLFNGIIRGLEKHGLAQQIPVIAVETKGCDVFNVSLEAGLPVQLEKISSVASSLASVYIPQETFDYATKYNSRSVVLDDINVLETCVKYSASNNVAVEPACGASLHLAYNPHIIEQVLNTKLSGDDVVVVIACGGSCMTTDEVRESLNSLKNPTA